MTTVLLAVTSLMGAGHLARMLIIAKALNDRGARAVIVSGGRALDHLSAEGAEIRQLPPLWSDGVDYSRLLTPEGPADDGYFDRRRRALLDLAAETRPDVVVTELFPFGRRALSAEYLALLAAVRPHARIFASIRDVLEPKKKPKRWRETEERLRAWYDGVLIHGEAARTPLALTWPPAEQIGDLLHYTGYVAPPPPPAAAASDEVLVAVGGGVLGRRLLAAAVEAARGGGRPWRLRVGGADAAAAAAELRAKAAGAPVTVEPALPDYRARLAGAACSVSLFGYNTATDLLTAGRPAVIAPMQEGGEKEQRIRAEAFADEPGFHFLSEPTTEALRSAVAAAIAGPTPLARRLNGAEKTAAILL